MNTLYRTPFDLPPDGTPPSPQWALEYLCGRLEGFQRHNLPIAAVSAAVRVAIRAGVPAPDIVAVLTPLGLTWDPETQEIGASPPAPSVGRRRPLPRDE